MPNLREGGGGGTLGTKSLEAVALIIRNIREMILKAFLNKITGSRPTHSTQPQMHREEVAI